MNKHTPKSEEVIKALKETPWTKDGWGNAISVYLPFNNSCPYKACDIRGWGYLTGGGSLGMDCEEAVKVQEFVEEHIETCVNQHEALKAKADLLDEILSAYNSKLFCTKETMEAVHRANKQLNNDL